MLKSSVRLAIKPWRGKSKGKMRSAGTVGRKKRLRGQTPKVKSTKVKSISKLIKEADALFSAKVRRIGAWEKDGELWNACYTSGWVAPIKKLHCGHYLSRFYKQARWDFDNARPQSMMANLWMKGDPVVFRKKLIEEIGLERVEAVEAKRFLPTKLSREFLEAKIEELKK